MGESRLKRMKQDEALQRGAGLQTVGPVATAGRPPERKPRLVRGGNAFGNDGMMRALEARHQPYLFKLKLTKNTKHYIGRLFHEPNWRPVGQSWKGRDGELTLPSLLAEFDKARAALMRVSALLRQRVNTTAEQFKSRSVWALCCNHLKRTLAAIGPPCLTLPARTQGNCGF